MRLFVAITPPAPALQHLARAVDDVRAETTERLTWSLPEQWHLTLAFLGEVDERRADRLGSRLARAAGRHPAMQLRVVGAGRFGSRRQGRVLWAGVTGDVQPLGRLAAAVGAAARREDIAVPARFRPHLTLARARQPTDLTLLVERLAGYEGPEWTAVEIVLVRSHLGAGPGQRSRHEAVSTWPLTGAAR